MPQLIATRIIDRIDRQALTLYCETWAAWQEAVEFVKKAGLAYPIKDKAGDVKCILPFPQVTIMRNYAQLLHRYQIEFGLLPAARAAVEMYEYDEKDWEMEAILRDTGTHDERSSHGK